MINKSYVRNDTEINKIVEEFQKEAVHEKSYDQEACVEEQFQLPVAAQNIYYRINMDKTKYYYSRTYGKVGEFFHQQNPMVTHETDQGFVCLLTLKILVQIVRAVL